VALYRPWGRYVGPALRRPAARRPHVEPACSPDGNEGGSGSWKHGASGRGLDSFKTLGREAGIPEDVHDAIMGHVGGSAVARRYGAMPLVRIAEELKRYPVALLGRAAPTLLAGVGERGPTLPVS